MSLINIFPHKIIPFLCGRIEEEEEEEEEEQIIYLAKLLVNQYNSDVYVFVTNILTVVVLNNIDLGLTHACQKVSAVEWQSWVSKCTYFLYKC